MSMDSTQAETSLEQASLDLFNNASSALRAVSTSKSILGRLSSKAVEIYDAAQVCSHSIVWPHYTYFYQGGNENAEILSQLASGACNLVYTILTASEQISLPDTTLNETDENLKQYISCLRRDSMQRVRILKSIRPGQQPSAHRPFRVLRKLGTTKSNVDITQLQVYKEQLFSMLVTFQVLFTFEYFATPWAHQNIALQVFGASVRRLVSLYNTWFHQSEVKHTESHKEWCRTCLSELLFSKTGLV